MRRILTPALWLASFVAVAVAATANAYAEKRVAFVMGNGAYAHAAPLPNPPNDARAVAASLERLGFDVVSGYDLGMDEMRMAVRDFSQKLNGADVALFFYAGHGMQVFGENYLIPVDAALKDEADLDFSAIKMNLVLRQMEREPRVKIIILDACRDNPFEQQLSRSMGKTRSASALDRGLAKIDAGGGTLIAFATDPGAVAFDGDDQHSPFTEGLLKHIETPGIDVGLMMRRVVKHVKDTTDNQQTPWMNVSLDTEVYLSGAPAAPNAGPAPAPAPAPQVVSTFDDRQMELVVWQSAERSGQRPDYEEYLRLYPKGKFAGLARNRLAAEERTEARANAAPDPAPAARSTGREAGSAEERQEQALGLNRADRMEVQRRLTLMGYDTNGVDGVFGGGTRRAVSAWQSQNSLAASGYLDRAQYSLLISQTETHYSQWQANQRARQRMVPAQNLQPAPQPQPVQQQQQQPQQGMGAKDVVEGVKAARDILNIFGR